MTKVTVIGAGIGGLSTALALKQAGIPFTVYESAAAIRPVGAGIIIASNAMQVFCHWGIAEAVAQQGNRISVLNLTRPGLEKLSSSNLACFEQKYGLSNIAIHRADLHRVLMEAVGREHIVTGKQLKQISLEKDSCLLSFADGSQVTAAYAIAADGIRSMVRKTLFPENELRDAGQTCWRGVAGLTLPGAYRHELNEAWGKGKRFGFVQLNEHQTYWYLLIDSPPADAATDIFPFLEDFHPLAAQMVRATPKEQWIVAPLLDLKPAHQWTRDRVCLVGDAAHATTPNLGQGACQAIEDAYVLGKLLRQYSIAEALLRYPDIRKQKAHYVVNTSWRIGKLAQLKNPWGIALRNMIMKATPARINSKQLEKIFALDEV
ncbi:FAD-dependent monooxygenase [Taibaiella koreensis]|uniref:FAD-dependent monooxygenase n=1 Tax=Taibaiella koreensis TaxID=1268548 RepID=UPI000E59BCE7|nr:FAD-dependent monooxygenase [Taibaiella koreensis]